MKKIKTLILKLKESIDVLIFDWTLQRRLERIWRAEQKQKFTKD